MGSMTKGQKAHDTKVFKAARELAKRITELQPPVSTVATLDAIKAQKCSPRVLCDAFWLMDNEPSRFVDYQTWHPRLRSLRNTPGVGEEMFALFH